MSDISRSEFCQAFAQAQLALGYSDVILAKIFQISRPTVGRWARGETAPHPIGRKPILEALARHLERSLLDEALIDTCQAHLIGKRCNEPALSDKRCFKHLSWKLASVKQEREDMEQELRFLVTEIDRLETILEV